ncbi:MAG TPA: nucleotidyltransferase domain-containing protein [Ignavibacteria bacterium]|nr:nucleotidyltransferase domain-containing protein [Ignavibacteria bacterium]HMR40897.1 nucleotidyltransferase domain-containing protein [Ignavibacteria bacterium]
MFGLNESIIEQIEHVFEEFPQIEEVLIYGSRAKEIHKPGSDIDLALKGDDLDHNLINLISLRLDELYLPFIFDISLFSKIANKDLIDHIDRVGKSFYRKEITTEH